MGRAFGSNLEANLHRLTPQMKTMKLLILFLLLAPSVLAQSVKLAWDPVPENSVTGYRVYQGLSPRDYSTNYPTLGRLNTTNQVTGLSVGVTYYFSVTAVAASGLESDYSNEVAITVPVPIPGNVRVVAMTWTGETNLQGRITPVATITMADKSTVTASVETPIGATIATKTTGSGNSVVFRGRATRPPFDATLLVKTVSAVMSFPLNETYIESF